MRAGKLTDLIVIERRGETVDLYGTVVEGWTTIATLRAQIVQASTEEFLKSAGTEAETAIIFRVRYREGIQPEDRILDRHGKAFDIKAIRELGRREGLDLRSTAAG